MATTAMPASLPAPAHCEQLEAEPDTQDPRHAVGCQVAEPHVLDRARANLHIAQVVRLVPGKAGGGGR